MKYPDLPESVREHLNFLFNPESPASLSRCLPQDVCARMMDLLSNEITLCSLLQDEDDLLYELRAKHNYEPTVNDYRVRFLFWNEYESAWLDGGREMILSNVHSLVCNQKTFNSMFLKQAKRVAFLVCRPAGYQAATRETLLHGMKHLRRILDLPEYDEKGSLNVRLLNLKAKIVAMVDMRVNGAPTQNIKQLNVNVDASSKSLPSDVRTMVQKGDLKSLQNRIAEIEQEIRNESGERGEQPIAAEIVSKDN